MAESRAGRLLRNAEAVAYWAAAAPVAACLPAALGYRLACLRGDWEYARRPEKRAEKLLFLRLGDLGRRRANHRDGRGRQ